MEKLINLELAIKALTGWETEPTDEEIEYTLRNLATDTNVGTNDTINRQRAIDAVTDELDVIDHVPQWVFDRLEKRLKQLPPAQPEPCEDDPRADVYYLAEKIGIHQLYALVVRLRGEPEPCEDAVSRAEILRMIDCINDHHAITPYKSVGAVTEHLTRIARSLPPVTPKQRKGKCMWCERLKERNLRIEYYWIDEEGCTASFSEPHIVATGIAKFCPNCGAKMGEVSNDTHRRTD